ncbi:MAG: complex I NDUFA9 subunit family protein [Halodesulfurarchaeum sp.]
MNIIVTGGTGFIGSHLCRALDDGHDVTALSRSPSGSDLPDSITVVSGDVTDYSSIVDSFEDQDVVVNLVALSPLFKPDGGDQMHFRVHLEGTRNVVRAAKEHGVSTIVQMSALGADPDGPTAYITAKGRAESVVRESGLEWTIFRPSVVFGEGSEFVEFTRKLTTPYVTALPGGGRTRFQPIWVNDLVDVLAGAVTDSEHRGQVYEIGGPEVLTLKDVAELVHREEGRSLTVVPIPMPLAGLGMAIADPLPFVPFGTDQYRSLRFDNTTASNDITAFGRSVDELRSFSSFLSEH